MTDFDVLAFKVFCCLAVLALIWAWTGRKPPQDLDTTH